MTNIDTFIQEVENCSEIEEVQELECPFCGKALAVEEYPLDEFWDDNNRFCTVELFNCSDFAGCGFEFQYTRAYFDEDCDELDYVEVNEVKEPR